MILASCNGGGSSGGGGGVIVTTAPSAPNSLSLVTPGSSPGLDPSPTISVGGVVSGNTVRLFSDPACTTTEIGSAVSSDTSVNITVSSALSVSSHTIYANATNAIGTSPCSSLSVSYTLATCPADFIPVPHNSSVGTTSDFCVMKYEAKAYHSVNQAIDPDGCNEEACTAVNWGLADHIPASSSTGTPWRRINATNASAECNSLNTQNGVSNKYDLISNPEWMTIARNAESVSSNFQAGVMARGWAANNTGLTPYDPWQNSAPAPSTDPNCLYNTGEDTCASSGDHLYRRTLALSNGEDIWDLSGNVWEWVDWSHTTAGLDLGPTTCAASWVEFPAVVSDACYTGGALLSNQVFPATSNGSSVEAFGRFYGGSGGAALRGGAWVHGTYAGAFTLNLYNSTASTHTNVGFRCVYRP